MTQKEIYKLVDDEVAKKPEAFGTFLYALVDAAFNTAEHIRTNWQDESTARVWAKVGANLDRKARDIAKNLGGISVEVREY